MNDLISRETVIYTITVYPHGDVWNVENMENMVYEIKNLPSAEPEITRCKDCKWCVEHYDTDGNAPYWICKNWDGGTDADGFCYEGEIE